MGKRKDLKGHKKGEQNAYKVWKSEWNHYSFWDLMWAKNVGTAEMLKGWKAKE